MAISTRTERPLDLLTRLYRPMQVIRQCEEQLAKSHQRGLIHGACHTYVGQEAIAVGVCAHLRPDDAVFSTHRGHGHALAKGLPPRELIAELYGRATGCSRGRGGSMHLFAPEIGLMGTSGIVGACILQAAGAGYSFKLLKTERVAVAFFGDGAVNNGAFHEGLNLAGIWKLPVLFVCENNQFATEVPFSYSAGNPSVAARAAFYGLPGHEVDGNDVEAIYAIAGEAVRCARSGGGATLIECKTYRTRPHAEGMGDFTYRTREEVEEWKTRCPIRRLRERLLHENANGQPSSAALDAIDAEVARDISAAQQFAEKSPAPDPKTAATHVYEESPAPSPPTPLPRVQGRGGKGVPLSPVVGGGEPLTPLSPVLGGEGLGVRGRETREITYMKATHEALAEEMAGNPAIFVMGEGIGERGGNFKTTEGLFALYGPERLRDTPICERGFVGLACGAAMTGTRPVVDFMFADFILDSVGEILNQIAKMRYMSSGRIAMPILLRGCIGIGHSAATHHSGNYYPLYAQFPGLRVVVPSTPYDAKGLFKRALRCQDPVLFLEHRELLTTKGPVPEQDYEIDFGKAIIVREGRDVTVVALALMVRRTLEVCERLAARGISVEVIDPRTVSPLDGDTILRSVQKTGRLLIVDEAFAPFGLGAEVAAIVSDAGFDDLDAPIRRLHGAFTPTPYSPSLEHAVTPQVEDIERAIVDLLEE
ncbi:MAG TPA: dehydrogenase E1 component subunit alpha/beta [Gemmataceae bacterium]|nr:dehydrogenase E1 component subunit alpha/beta [Gemmataceae bacterium]